jgi:hypothetical protein
VGDYEKGKGNEPDWIGEILYINIDAVTASTESIPPTL